MKNFHFKLKRKSERVIDGESGEKESNKMIESVTLGGTTRGNYKGEVDAICLQFVKRGKEFPLLTFLD